MAKCICPSDLRHRVTIEAMTPTRDAVGGLSGATWTPVANVFASIEPASASERWQQQRMQAEAFWKIGIRYRPDVTTKHRVTFSGRVFNIRSVVDQDMRKRFLMLSCDEEGTTP